MKQLYTLLTAMLFLLPGISSSQCIPSATDTLHVNKVAALIHNGGDMFWDLVGSPGYLVPFTTDPDSQRHSAFASALWLGGLDASGQLHVAAQTYRQSGYDYFAGPYRSTHQYACGNGVAVPSQVFHMMRLSNGDILMLAPGAVYVYQPTTQQLTQHVLPIPKQRYNAVETGNGKILLFGEYSTGQLIPDQTLIMDVGVYNPTVHIILNQHYRDDEGAAVLLPNGKVFLAGLLGSEIYDPLTGTSQVAPNGPSCRDCGMVTLSNGNVLLAGGVSTLSNKVFEYDPVNDVLSNGPTMFAAYFNAETILLNNGKVLVAGFDRPVSIVDPVAGTADTLGGSPMSNTSNSPLSLFKANSGEILIFDDHRVRFYYPDSNWVGTLPYGQPSGISAYLGGKRYLMQNGLIYNSLSRKFEGIESERLYRVNQAALQQYQSNPNPAGCLLGIYPQQPDCNLSHTLADYPWQGNVSAGEEATMAPWNDFNNDQQYDPTQMDTPDLPGDEALWWVMHDDGLHTESGGQSFGVQLKSIAYAWSSDQTPQLDTMLDYVTFYHHEIKNFSGQDYHDMMAGIWMDLDIGYYSDDFVGCDTSRNLGFTYNGDSLDETSAGYGLHPPALGVKVLCGPKGTGMSSFVHYENDFSLRGNPETAQDFYNYMNAVWKDGSHVVDNGLNGYPGSAPGPQTNYMYPGDPGWCGGPGDGGWSEVSAGNQPFDRRFLVNVGPFDLAAGETVTLNYAVVWARGYYNDNLGSVCELQAAADAAQAWFDQEMGLYCQTSHTAVEEPADAGFGIYPNPSEGDFRLELKAPLQRDGLIEVFDLAGRKVHVQAAAAGERTLRVSPEGLRKGMYIVKLSSGDKVAAGRVIIQ